MDENFYDCIDCGTENCPCYLALTGDCLVCSRLSGKDCCDCDWKGVCVYNEFIQGGKRVNNIRNEFEAQVKEKKKYEEGTEVLVLEVGRGFALKCSWPGSYVFLRCREDESFYSIPISVLKSDIRGGKIHLAVKELSAKSKRILTADTLVVRGVYRNGILGIKDIIGTRGRVDTARKIMIVTKGIGFAPAALLIAWIGGRTQSDIFIDKDKIDEKLIEEYLPECLNGKVSYIDLRREFEYKKTERVSEIYREGGHNTLVVLTSDYYLSEIGKVLKIDAKSNNYRLCCGEGICGACSYTDDFGRTFKMCKCSASEIPGIFDKF